MPVSWTWGGPTLPPAVPPSDGGIGFAFWQQLLEGPGRRAALATAVAAAVLLGSAAAWCCFSRALGRVTKAVIQVFDHRLLGVDVRMRRMRVNPCALKVVMSNCTVDNPHGYSESSLMTMQKVQVNLGARRLLCSCGRRVVVQRLELIGVCVNVEKKWGSSNVSDVLKHLESASEGGSSHDASSSEAEDGGTEAGHTKVKRRRPTKLEVRSVAVYDVSINLRAFGLGMVVKAADMEFDNLSSALDGQEMQVVTRLVFASVLKTVVANMGMAAAQQALNPWAWGGRSDSHDDREDAPLTGKATRSRQRPDSGGFWRGWLS